MTVPEILKDLELHTGKFPRQAMEAAIEQREAITPELIRTLETVAAAPAEWASRQDYMLHTFATYLLAQFQEQAAYPLLVRIVSAPGDIPYKLFADTITEALGRILASVYDGNPRLLQDLVENQAVDEFVRGAALEAFLALVFSGRIQRETVVEYFRTLFHGKLEREDSFVWDALAITVADLPAPELREELRWACDEGFANPGLARLEELEAELAHPRPDRLERYELIGNTVDEMEWWAAFNEENLRLPRAGWQETPSPRFEPDPTPRPYSPPQPYVREAKAGRNDPCPCGSGKKYKKCCGG